jgi:hypothetical protein
MARSQSIGTPLKSFRRKRNGKTKTVSSDPNADASPLGIASASAY